MFVTPEYDSFAPADRVNAIQVILQEWFYEPARVVRYGGISGDLRSAQVLSQLLCDANVHTLPRFV